MSRLVSLLYGGEEKEEKGGGESRKGADTPECTPRLAGSSNDARGLSQEPGHPKTLCFPRGASPGAGIASHGGGGRSWGPRSLCGGEAWPGPVVKLLRSDGEGGKPAGVPATDKTTEGVGKGRRGPLGADLSLSALVAQSKVAPRSFPSQGQAGSPRTVPLPKHRAQRSQPERAQSCWRWADFPPLGSPFKGLTQGSWVRFGVAFSFFSSPLPAELPASPHPGRFLGNKGWGPGGQPLAPASCSRCS